MMVLIWTLKNRTGMNSVDYLAKVRDKWQAPMNIIMNLQVQ